MQGGGLATAGGGRHRKTIVVGGGGGGVSGSGRRVSTVVCGGVWAGKAEPLPVAEEKEYSRWRWCLLENVKVERRSVAVGRETK